MAPRWPRARIFPDARRALAPQPALIATGSRRFEQARARLADLAKREPEQVSDADTVEFLVRGELATQAYLLTASSR